MGSGQGLAGRNDSQRNPDLLQYPPKGILRVIGAEGADFGKIRFLLHFPKETLKKIDAGGTDSSKFHIS